MKKTIIVTEGAWLRRLEQPTETVAEGEAKEVPAKEEKEKQRIATAIGEALQRKGFLSAEELASTYPSIHAAVGGVINAVENLPPLVLFGVAPPEGKSWKDISEAVEGGKPFKLEVWLVGGPHSPRREGKLFVYDEYLVRGEVTFERKVEETPTGEKKEGPYVGHLVTPKSTVIGESFEVIPSWEKRKRELLTEEEIEKLKEEFGEEEPEGKEEVSLEELLEEEERVAREKEEEELIEDAIARIGGGKKLLKHVLLAKVADLIRRSAALILQKAGKKSRDDVEGAKRKLEEGLKALSEGDGLEALEDFATARFYLFDHDSCTEPLVNAFDDLMDIAWNAYKGRKYSKERAREVAQRILRLIESPRGKRAEPPRRVDSPRDARLWEMAKRIVKDEYRDIEEDSERFWQVVSRIFTRMKLRLGGAREEAVEKIVSELREEHGKLPAAGKGAKTAKEVERLKEKHLRSKGS